MKGEEVENLIKEVAAPNVNENGFRLFELSSRQVKLFNFVKDQHDGQFRMGGEPYINHLIRVGESAHLHNGFAFGREIGWCHDLLEDQMKEYDV